METTETIEHLPLPIGLAGYWDQGRDVIVINSRLTARSRRATLEHERVHRERGDSRCPDPWFDKKQELAVEREAARRLIPIEEIIDGLLWSRDHNELADHWNVDLHMVMVRLGSLTTGERSHIERFLDLEEEFMGAWMT